MNNEENNLEKDIPDMTETTVTEDVHDIDDMNVSREADEATWDVEEVNEEGEVDTRTTIKKLREKIKKLEAEKKEYLDLSQRTRADYMNLKKEIDSERITGRKFATKRFIEELLPVLDAYDMAQVNKESWEKVDQNWRVGIEYIFGQLRTVLEREGVTSFGKVGDVFDPMLHESMETVPVTDSSKNDTIMKVLQSGYRMHDTVLRPARVHTGHFEKGTE
ncbi:MAG: hypothetical protein RIQ41_206 [Candidatus Parcubacteria bacterium]|jgi:molecular chaperone GrpE